jgi:D-glycerate 3-kinase
MNQPPVKDGPPMNHDIRAPRVLLIDQNGEKQGVMPTSAALEAAEDPHALWRTHINQALAGSYARAWAMLDALAFLAAPDWETVPRWRAQQEAGLTRATGRPGMDSAAIARFCAHYERLIRWQLADTPRHAGFTLRLDGQRRVIGQARS